MHQNLRGLKIHQASTKCLVQEPTVSVPGETQEEPGRESPHRAQHLQAPEAPPPGRVVQKARVKWLSK